MKKTHLLLCTVVILALFVLENCAKSTIERRDDPKIKNKRKPVLQDAINSKNGSSKNETKRQFINRPRIRYFGNRPYIWMKPSPLTQRTIVTTHIPRPPLALPYSARVMRLLASKYPSLYGRQIQPQGYGGSTGYDAGMPQGSLFGPAFHGVSMDGTDGAQEFADDDEGRVGL